jgi:sugar lactone lactonase YvrE
LGQSGLQRAAIALALLTTLACSSKQQVTDSGTSDGQLGGHFPLVRLMDVPLPGNPTRFDYQDIDPTRGQLVIAHMDDSSVLIVSLADGSTLKELPGVGTVRGVLAASEIGRIFATAEATDELVMIDSTSLTEMGRAPTGSAPDGIAWDPTDKVVAVSDQGDGAVSLITNGGTGKRTSVPLGVETGNVAFDAGRGVFWASVVTAAGTVPNQLAAIDPVAGTVKNRIALPGCEGAHGLRIHPDGNSAFVACEGNYVLTRVDLGGTNAVTTAPTGAGPDVLSIDASEGWLYVAAESGDLVVFDIAQPGLVVIDHEHPGDGSHTVAVDPASHRVFFPLTGDASGKPILRIMKPAGL